MSNSVKTFIGYNFSFEPPLNSLTERLDLVDAVALQEIINASPDKGDDYYTNNYHVVDIRKRRETQLGSLFVYAIDYLPEEKKIPFFEKYLGGLIDRAVTVSKI